MDCLLCRRHGVVTRLSEYSPNGVCTRSVGGLLMVQHSWLTQDITVYCSQTFLKSGRGSGVLSDFFFSSHGA